jgi:2-polyprenyl-3-methyl-5-hydroxy-6-metoxy-1,4-benzoquinol methylase
LKKKTVDGLDLAKCKNCGLEFVKLMPLSKMWAEDRPGTANDYYSRVYCSQAPPKFHYGLNKIMSYLNSTGKQENINRLSLLDVGCGNGEFLLMCKDKGFNITGVEQSYSAAELCKKRGLNNIHIKDIGDLEETFDIITLFDVAEHLEDLKAFFKKIHHRLNSDGIVYIEAPRKSIVDVYLNILGLVTPIKNNRITREHVQLFSNKSLHILLKNSRFSIVSFEKKQSLSWANKKQYIFNLGIKSNIIAKFLEKIANSAIKLRLMGHNKGIVLAKKIVE